MVKIIKPFISHILELKRGMWAGKISESAIASKRYKNSAMGLFEKRHIKHMDIIFFSACFSALKGEG